MSATSIASRFAIEVGSRVLCPNKFEAYVTDKWLQNGYYVCEVSYDNNPERESDIFYMSELCRVHDRR